MNKASTSVGRVPRSRGSLEETRTASRRRAQKAAQPDAGWSSPILNLMPKAIETT
jgi:hypothetical protein